MELSFSDILPLIILALTLVVIFLVFFINGKAASSDTTDPKRQSRFSHQEHLHTGAALGAGGGILLGTILAVQLGGQALFYGGCFGTLVGLSISCIRK